MIIDDHSRLLVGGGLFYNDNAYNFQKVLKAAGLSFNPFDKQQVKEKDRFLSNDLQEMMNRLDYLKDTRGIGLFTAGPGMGKSFALRCFTVNANLKISVFAEKGCHFSPDSIQVYSLNHHITCRLEARQALIYQLVLGLTGENDMYNYLNP